MGLLREIRCPTLVLCYTKVCIDLIVRDGEYKFRDVEIVSTEQDLRCIVGLYLSGIAPAAQVVQAQTLLEELACALVLQECVEIGSGAGQIGCCSNGCVTLGYGQQSLLSLGYVVLLDVALCDNQIHLRSVNQVVGSVGGVA